MTHELIIRFPVFLRERCTKELRKYYSILELSTRLELIDVENEEFEVWDSDGQPVKLIPDNGLGWIGMVPDKQQQTTLSSALEDFASGFYCQIDSQSSYEAIYDRIANIANDNWVSLPWWKKFLKRF